jgi:hypothetical protein
MVEQFGLATMPQFLYGNLFGVHPGTTSGASAVHSKMAVLSTTTLRH